MNFTPEQQTTINAYHRLLRSHLFDGGPDQDLPTYKGIRIVKFPSDIWLLQEIIHKTKPEIIVEVGTLYGGTALYLADLCETLGHGHIITVDNGELLGYVPTFPGQARITPLMGNCEDLYPKVKELTTGKTTMVILDCCHYAEHVTTELHTYGTLVTPGQYLIVEDTDVHGIGPQNRPGPQIALEQFLQNNTDYEQDLKQHKYLVTTNPGGYLKRK